MIRLNDRVAVNIGPEKEVTVYYKMADEGIILLTVKARYGQEFPRR